MPTLFDKIWDSHVVGVREDGRVLVYVDRNVIHDLHAPHAFGKLRAAGRAARRPELTVAVTDHTVDTRPNRTAASNPQATASLAATRAGAEDFGLHLIGLDSPVQGIVHVVSP